MKEKKQEMTITIECDNKETLKNVLNSLKDAMKPIAKPEAEEETDDKEPEAFRPKKGDICTCVVDGDIDAIFRYDGKIRTDDDDQVWIDGDLGLTWSGDLFRPYMVIYGEDTEYDRDCCRLANEEEINLFNAKVKEFEENKKDAGWIPKKGDAYYTPSFEYEPGVFEPVETRWEGKSMEVYTNIRGWCFQTEGECQSLCDKLNEAIRPYKDVSKGKK